MFSTVLSLAVLCALGLHVLPDVPEQQDAMDRRQSEAPKAPSSLAEKLKPTSVTAVKLPPPPVAAPAPKMKPLKVQKPVLAKAPFKPAPLKSAKRAIPNVKENRSFLKPAPAREAFVEAVSVPDEPESKRPTIAPDEKATIKGRALLRLLEHGSGPSVEIAWPESANSRERLYLHFRDCYGLRVAVLTEKEQLFVDQGNPGTPWQLNLDAFSGFMRQHGGGASRQETAEAGRIRRLHRLRRQGASVRVFPRHVDAVLLGGLQQAVGVDYDSRERIRARYELRGGRVYVENIQADGVGYPDRIDLSSALNRPCGIGLRT